MGCPWFLPSKRERIDVINGEILEFRIAIRNLKRGIEEAKARQAKAIDWYEMEIKDLEKEIKDLEKEKLDLWEKISAEKEELDIAELAFYNLRLRHQRLL